MDLQSLQATFGRVMRGESGGALTGLVRPAGGLSASRSLGVYRRNMQSALTSALSDVYPVCAQLLGEARFRGIATGYMRLHPSEDSDLNLYGEGFAGFLRLYCGEYAGKDPRLACLPDLARLEWRYHFAYYAEDDPAFDFEAFARVAESDRGRIVLEASRALALMSSVYPLRAVWRTRAYPGAGAVSPGGAPREHLCVCRDGLRPALTRLPRELYRLLGDLIKGATLDALSRRFEQLDRRLPRLLEKGWVVSFRLKPDA